MKKIIAVGTLAALFAITGHAFAAINVGLDQSANASIGLSGSASSSGSSVNVAASTNATTSGNTSTGTLTVVRGNLDSMNIDRNAPAASNAGMVSNDTDLSTYVAASMQGDKYLERVSSDQDRIIVKYREPARFLGFIPGAKVTAKVTVDADGTVHVRYPWYRFLLAVDGNRKDLESELQSEVAQSASSGQWSAQTRARIISTIHTSLSRASNWSDEYNSDTHINTDGSMDASSSSAY